ncbi:kinase-like domain-containing protein [Abortiporus biennis]|nr:kinase-like domain-containing protein [Abortiporus biennis]
MLAELRNRISRFLFDQEPSFSSPLKVYSRVWDPSNGPRLLSKNDEKLLRWKIRLSRLFYGRVTDEFRINNAHKLGRSTMIKRGDENTLNEALTMDYITRHTSIPVPRVRDVLKLPDERIWIIMDYIESDTLDDVWLSLTEQERLNCMQQLQGYVNQLRALPPPDPTRVQAVNGGNLHGFRMHGKYGPYNSIAAFHEARGHSYIPTAYPQYTEDFDKISGKSWKIMFAHGDLGPHNILWRDGQIVAIID